MSDFDYHCGTCGAITLCATHDRPLADCSPRNGCVEVCSKVRTHRVEDPPEITTVHTPEGWKILFDDTGFDIDPAEEEPTAEVLAAFQEKRRERLAMLMARFNIKSGMDYQYEEEYEQLYSTTPIERWLAVTGDETYNQFSLSNDLDHALSVLGTTHLNGEYNNVPYALWDLEAGKQVEFRIEASAVLLDGKGNPLPERKLTITYDGEAWSWFVEQLRSFAEQELTIRIDTEPWDGVVIQVREIQGDGANMLLRGLQWLDDSGEHTRPARLRLTDENGQFLITKVHVP